MKYKIAETMPNNLPPPTPVRGIRRVLYMALGFFFVGMALLGFLPGWPRTPFLLLASYFFVRSSPKLNERLLRSRIFGPFLRDWQEKRAVRRSVKVLALVLVPISIAFSIYIGNLPWWLIIIVCALGAIGMFVVICLPVVKDDEEPVEVEEKLEQEV